MVASPRALHRITVWWRCNQDRSSILPLALTRAPAHSRCSRVSGDALDAFATTLRTAKRLQHSLLSVLKFIACGFGLVFSFWHDTNFLFFVVDERTWWNAFCQEN